MGKGGDKDVKVKSVSTKSDEPASSKEQSRSNPVRKFKLNNLATEELRKWAKSYALPNEGERDELLELLVSAFIVN